MDTVQVKSTKKTKLPRLTPENGAEMRECLVEWGYMWEVAMYLKTSTAWLEKICAGTAGMNPSIAAGINWIGSPEGWQESPARLRAKRGLQAGRPPEVILPDQVQLVNDFIAACGGAKMAAGLAGVSPAAIGRYADGHSGLPPHRAACMRAHLYPGARPASG